MIHRHQIRPHEQGQALIFGILAVLLLIVPVMMIYNVGTVVNRRIRIQNAADAASLAGAQVQADVLSTVSWINNGMSAMYGHAIRRIVDVNTYATMASFIEHGEAALDDITTSEININTSGSLSPDAIREKYKTAWEDADEWVPKCREWMAILSKIEHSLALITPDLIEMEIYRTAGANAMIDEMSRGLSMTTYYKKFVMDANVSNVDIMIRKLVGLETGWELQGTNGTHYKVLHLSENSWEIQDLMTGDWVRVTKLTEDLYEVTTHDKDGDETVLIHPHDGGGDVITSDGSVTTTPRDDGGVTMTFPDGTSVGIRVDPDTGAIQQDTNNDGHYDQTLGEEVNDQGLRVDNVSSITVGSVRIKSFNPIRVWFNKVRITMYLDGTMHIGINIAPYVAISDLEHEDYLRINNRRTDKDADGRWYQYYNSERIRHRLTPDPGDGWDFEYNLRMIGDYLTEDDLGEYGKGRFGAFHGVLDQVNRFNENYTIDDMPEWLLYRKDDHDAVYQDSDGWFNTVTGSVERVTLHDDTTREKYHQTRDCWHDSDEEKKGFWIKSVEDKNTGSMYLQLFLCPVCYYSSKNNGIPDLPDFPRNRYPRSVWDNIPPGRLSDYDFDPPLFNNADSHWPNSDIPRYILDAYPLGPPMSSVIPGGIVLPSRLDHDSDGNTDVRKYPSDAADPLARKYANLVNWVQNNTDDRYDRRQSFSWSSIRRPLVLTEDFFKFGSVTVGIWQSPDNSLYVLPYPSVRTKQGPSAFVPVQGETVSDNQNTINRALLSCPEWGFLATASSRVAFKYTDLEGKTGVFSRAGDLAFLDDVYPTYQYDRSISLEDETDVRRRRQIFARRYYGNLSDPLLSAVLVPTYEAIRSEDIDVHAGIDTGTNYLYKMALTESPTRINYFFTGTTWGSRDIDLNDKFGQMRYERNGQGLNVSHEDLAEIVTH